MSMMFLAMEARAHVGGGDGPACSRALREAEHLFEGRRTGDDSDWIVYFDAAELVGEGAHCFRDLRSPRTAQEFIARAEERADARIWFWHKIVRRRFPATQSHGRGGRSSVIGCPWVRPLREDRVRPRTDHLERPRGSLCIICWRARVPAVAGLNRWKQSS
jgi:hypothetical protein